MQETNRYDGRLLIANAEGVQRNSKFTNPRPGGFSHDWDFPMDHVVAYAWRERYKGNIQLADYESSSTRRGTSLDTTVHPRPLHSLCEASCTAKVLVAKVLQSSFCRWGSGG